MRVWSWPELDGALRANTNLIESKPRTCRGSLKYLPCQVIVSPQNKTVSSFINLHSASGHIETKKNCFLHVYVYFASWNSARAQTKILPVPLQVTVIGDADIKNSEQHMRSSGLKTSKGAINTIIGVTVVVIFLLTTPAALWVSMWNSWTENINEVFVLQNKLAQSIGIRLTQHHVSFFFFL